MQLALKQVHSVDSHRPERLILNGIQRFCQRSVWFRILDPAQRQMRREFAVLGVEPERLHRRLNRLRQSP